MAEEDQILAFITSLRSLGATAVKMGDVEVHFAPPGFPDPPKRRRKATEWDSDVTDGTEDDGEDPAIKAEVERINRGLGDASGMVAKDLRSALIKERAKTND